MNDSITLYTLFSYYGIAILYLLLTFIVGKMIRLVLLQIKEAISAFSLLCNILTGWVTLVTFYSIVVTQGKTVNVLFLVLFILYFVFSKKDYWGQDKIPVTDHNSQWWIYILLIAFFAFGIFLFQVDRIMDWQTGMFQELYGDFCYNIKLTQFLNLGFENRHLTCNFVRDVAPMPYHYFEMWTTAMIYKPLGLIAGVCHMVTTPVICTSVMMLCLVSIWERNRRLNRLALISVLGCFFLMDIIQLLEQIHPRLTVSCTYLLGLPRAMPSIIWILFLFVLYYYDKKKEAFYVLLSIPILTLVPAVAVLGVLGLLLLKEVIQKKQIIWSLCIPYGLFALLYASYVAFSQGDHMGGEPFHWGLLRLYITQPVIYFLAYLHCFIVLWLINRDFLKSKIKTFGWSLIFLFLVTETFSVFLRAYNYDATQFTSGSIPYFLFALYTTSFLYIVSKSKINTKLTFLVCAFVFLNICLSYHVYGRPFPVNNQGRELYIKEVLDVLPNQKEYRIGVYADESQKADNMVCGLVDGIAYPDFLDTYLNGVWHYAINKGSWDIRSDWDKTPFRDYYTKQKASSSYISDDEIRMNFIKENAIEYVRIYKSATPSECFLSNLSMIAEDQKSGERFYKVIE